MVKNQVNSSTTIGKINCSLNTRLLGHPPCHASSIPHTSSSCRSETKNYTASSTPSVPPYRSPWFQESRLWNSPHSDNDTRFLFFQGSKGYKCAWIKDYLYLFRKTPLKMASIMFSISNFLSCNWGMKVIHSVWLFTYCVIIYCFLYINTTIQTFGVSRTFLLLFTKDTE